MIRACLILAIAIYAVPADGFVNLCWQSETIRKVAMFDWPKIKFCEWGYVCISYAMSFEDENYYIRDCVPDGINACEQVEDGGGISCEECKLPLCNIKELPDLDEDTSEG